MTDERTKPASTGKSLWMALANLSASVLLCWRLIESDDCWLGPPMLMSLGFAGWFASLFEEALVRARRLS